MHLKITIHRCRCQRSLLIPFCAALLSISTFSCTTSFHWCFVCAQSDEEEPKNANNRVVVESLIDSSHKSASRMMTARSVDEFIVCPLGTSPQALSPILHHFLNDTFRRRRRRKIPFKKLHKCEFFYWNHRGDHDIALNSPFAISSLLSWLQLKRCWCLGWRCSLRHQPDD